jgi:DNA-binding beta-propeller fold protein YncE
VFVASGDTGSEECYPNGGSLTTSVGDEPGGVAVDSAYHTAYVANLGGGSLSILDDATRSASGHCRWDQGARRRP